ncbi:MAG: shikimate dehydrogenase [Alphaproteobacteria bacterium HGW-Alphaproteobacteria-18]|nr:MAG: shikimate dehydrogenase [Alphaproteobacteria bacterium HGW-Alphaproteobacteria-18]
MTHLLGVVGDPVTHSLSPFIHNGWLRAHQIDAVYSAFEVKGGELASGLDALARQGVIGLNITLPHKEEAMRLAASVSGTAHRLGAVNFLVRREDGWIGDNTDAPGFGLTLDFGDIEVSGRNVFLLGAGGSARAVASVLADRGARLTICNRTAQRAEALARDLAPEASILSLEEGLKQLPSAALVVNTLSLGHSGGNLKLPEAAGGIFYDISYGKGAAAALTEAKAKGWRSLDGLGMLVAQAAISFEHWFGVMPDMAEAHARCRRLVEATS